MDDRGLQLSTLLRTDQATLSQALSTFIEIGQVGKSASTVKWYQQKLGNLVEWLGPQTPIVSVMRSDLMDYVSHLKNKRVIYEGGSTRPQIEGSLSIYSIHGSVRIIRHFFKWLNDNEVILENPATKLPLPRLPKPAKPGISEIDLRKILTAARGNVRDYAILRFLESTGCRLGGVVNLKLDDLNLGEDEPGCRRTLVHEKGDKDRTVFMTPGALEALKDWIVFRNTLGVEFPGVFLGKFPGRGWHPLTESGVYGILKRYARKTGVEKNWSPHQWRHRFARRLLQQGLGLGQVSQILGHEDVGVTIKYYGQFAVGQLQDGYDQFMPDIDVTP